MTWIKYFKSLNSYKKAFWLYLVLIFIEGAMRKWFMPGASNFWYIVREPIVLYIFLGGWAHGWLKSAYAITFMVIASISLVLTMAVGHQNFIVAFWGFRIWFMHIPFIFIMARILNREDLLRILKFLIIVFIPMTALYLVQWFSPRDAWINKSLGEVETADNNVVDSSLSVASSLLRVSGTFVHPVGSSYYNPIMCTILAASMLSVYYRKVCNPFKGMAFPLFALCYVVVVIISGSRGATVQSIVTILFLALMTSMFGGARIFGRTVMMIIGISLLAYLVATFQVGGSSLIDPLLERFSDASEAEGGTSGIFKSRILEGYMFWNAPNLTMLGQGLGLSSNFASQLLTGGYSWILGEYASQQMVGEMGLILGGLVFFLRIGIVAYLFFKCFIILKRRRDVLPMSLWTLSPTYFNSQHFNITYCLGFVCIVMILLLTSIKTSPKKIRNKSNRYNELNSHYKKHEVQQTKQQVLSL